jgi:hypothetical protein
MKEDVNDVIKKDCFWDKQGTDVEGVLLGHTDKN